MSQQRKQHADKTKLLDQELEQLKAKSSFIRQNSEKEQELELVKAQREQTGAMERLR